MSRLTASCPAPRTRYEGLVLWLKDERINLDTGEWSNCITLDRDQWSVIPPAHVVAAVKGGV
ncbi:hypothetical protein [Paracoccus hibiscisoli]|uniref:hypothetical protein n=1 Tax=Paracoccus hibiscisoli TaxID=2023261 RepID=UPI0023F21B51|nr:hypothetical protein [Paracoccus hibiscisoli]